MITRDRESIELNPRKYDLSGLPTRFFNPGEIERLLCLMESVNPETVVEFGCQNGRTAVAALRNIPGIKRYVGVDVKMGYQTKMKAQRKEVPIIPGELALSDPRFEVIVKDRGTFDLLPFDLPTCDVVFIDADHSREGVINDYALAGAITRDGGLIIFHDDNCLPVVQVTETLNDLCSNGRDIKHVKDTWLAYEVV